MKNIYSEQLGNRILNFINAFMAYSRVITVLIDQFNTRSNILNISSSVTY
jgi:hypothetical protein